MNNKIGKYVKNVIKINKLNLNEHIIVHNVNNVFLNLIIIVHF